MTGELRWVFHTIPQRGEYGADSWPAESLDTAGGANSWAGIAIDEDRGLAFVPTGSPSFDFYGDDRHGDNLFANSLIALTQIPESEYGTTSLCAMIFGIGICPRHPI